MTPRPHTLAAEAQAVLDYWFKDETTGRMDIPKVKLWFMGGKAVDEYLKSRFSTTLQQARDGELDGWTTLPESALALIVVLDQFNRNIHRGTAEAFACDQQALAICKLCLDKGFHQHLNQVQRLFCYLPLEHDESTESQELSLRLFQAMADKATVELSEFADRTLKSAKEHKAIIDQFGRYPHRNSVLGRPNTSAEEQWLQDSGKRFGQ